MSQPRSAPISLVPAWPAVRRPPRLAGLLAFSALAASCAPSIPPSDEVQAVVSMASVPADVACVRLTAAGPSRTVVRELPVTEGTAVSESFSGLPLGMVAFMAEAFSGECDAVTKSTIPGWASEPETVSLVLGRLTTVSMTLNRNGRARVNVDFNDDSADAGARDVGDAD
jgi:hypothetical protein